MLNWYSRISISILPAVHHDRVPPPIRPTDRVLEIGTAAGAITMAVAAIVAPANVITYDANPAMVADARRNFTANYMDDVHAEIGMRRNRSR
jgi:tRNA A58 N-methylase Trm61